MQNTSDLYKSIVSQKHWFEYRVIIDGVTYSTPNLYAMTQYNTLFEGLSIGNCYQRKLVLYLRDVTPENLNTIIPQIRAVDASRQSEWLSKCNFFVDTIESSPLTTDTVVTSYDAMQKANVIYFKSGTWVSKTADVVMSEIAEDMGIEIEAGTALAIAAANISIDYIPVSGEQGTTDREMLSFIAAMMGGNFYINDANELELVMLDLYSREEDEDIAFAIADHFHNNDPTALELAIMDSSSGSGDIYEIPINKKYVSLDISNEEQVVGVRVWLDDETFFYAPSDITVDEWESLAGNKIEYECPYGNQSLVDGLYARLVGKIYQPYSMEGVFIDPAAELGDAICIDGSFHVYLTNQTLNIDALGQSSLSAAATQSLESLYPTLSPIKREVAKASAGIIARLEVDEGRIIAEISRASEAEETLRTTITETVESVEISFSRSLTEVEEDLAGHASEQRTWIRYDETGMELGRTSDPMKAKLEPSKLDFLNGTYVVSEYGADGASMPRLTVSSQFNLGDFAFIQRSDGSLDLKHR